MNHAIEGNKVAPGEIRPCDADEMGVIGEIINDAAQAYQGVIPADRWKAPYMSRLELSAEACDGVRFWGYAVDGLMLGVMGLQDKHEVALIRHAYVRNPYRGQGIGGRLLRHLEGLSRQPILVGTWAAASWAIRFYEKHGYRSVCAVEKDRLLARYWRIPKRQIETSVVLGNPTWFCRRSDGL